MLIDIMRWVGFLIVSGIVLSWVTAVFITIIHDIFNGK